MREKRPDWKALTTGSTLLMVFLSCQPSRSTHPVIPETNPSDWGMNSLWDDGLAEVAHYQARRPVYGQTRIFQSVLITVKEEFSRRFYVKADNAAPAESLLPVLKLNIASTIPTDNYDYHYLTSIFVSRRDPAHLIKLTNGSQEWCGNTFKEVRNWGGVSSLAFHSYFDQEGDGSLPLQFMPGDLLEDQLPLTLRSLPFKAGYRRDTRILDSLVTNRAQPPQWRSARIQVEGLVTLGERRTWEVSVQREKLSQRFWFEEAYPHLMVQFASGDGRELRLQEVSRRVYW